MERLAGHPAGPLLLFAFAVAEGCLFPAPTEALLAALALARPRRAAALTALATAGSVAGGLAGYLFGTLLWERAALPVLAWYGLEGGAAAVERVYRDNLALALLTSGYTPVPWMLYAMTAGALGIPLLPFVALAVAGRGLKYALVGILARVAGPPLARLLRRHPAAFALAAAAAAAAVVVGYLWFGRG